MFQVSMSRRSSPPPQDQLLWRVPPSATVSSTQQPQEQSGDDPRPDHAPHTGPPASKRARMHAGSAGSAGRSVAARLKQAASKETANGVSPQAKSLKSPQSLPKCVPLNVRQGNTVRVIAQYLRDLGLHETVDALVQESGCRVENSHAARLRDAVQRGHWNDALAILAQSRNYLTPQQLDAAKVLILEEKFYDLISRKETPQALRLIRCDFPAREELESKRADMIRMLFLDPDNPKNNAELAKFRSRHDRRKLAARLQRVLPSSYMLPPGRLDSLVEQAWRQQIARCPLHLRNDVAVDPGCLFADHICANTKGEMFTCSQSLKDHSSEVWCVQFSPCGRFIASGSRMSSIAVWAVDLTTRNVTRLRTLSVPLAAQHGDLPVSCLAWSHDSQLLAVCGTDEQPFDTTVFCVDSGAVHRMIRSHPASTGAGAFSSAAFFRAKCRVLICGNLKGHLQLFDMDKSESNQDAWGVWEGFRIRAVHGMKDGRTVLAADTHNRLRMYRFDIRRDETIFTEDAPIVSFTVHSSERYILVTTKRNGLRMWDMKSRSLIRSFSGAFQGEYVIHAAFGGVKDQFIATGTDDRRVIVWNVDESRPLAKLKGHKGTVNAVSWNPVDPSMLASCSDDQSIKVWLTKDTARMVGAKESSGSKDSRPADVEMSEIKKEMVV